MSDEMNELNDVPVESMDAEESDALPEVTENMSGPAKLDLNPAPKSPVRLSKKAGAAGIAIAAALVMVIFFAIMSRGPSANKAGTATNAPVDSAATSGDSLTHDLEQRKAAADDMARRNDTDGSGAKASEQLNAGSQLSAASVPDLEGNNVPGAVGQPPLKISRVGGKGGTVPDLNVSGGMSRAPQNGANGVSAIYQKTAEQRVREAQYQSMMEAMKSPTGVSQHSSGSGGMGGLQHAIAGALGAGSGPGAQLIEALAAHATGAGNQAVPSANAQMFPNAQQDDQNLQGQKESFLSRMQKPQTDVTLQATRTPQMTPYEVKAGWDIPAALEQGINTDLPGQIRALVRENVFDTATGRYLLIPQGSKLIGSYNSHVAYGQSRVQVSWERIIYPDGSSISLGQMVGQDTQGMSGFHDKVNNHYIRLASMALLTSAFSAGISIAANQGQTASPYGVQTNQQIASQALAQQMGELGMEVTRRNMNIQPTITIPIGYRFNVRVNKDMIFERPYVSE